MIRNTHLNLIIHDINVNIQILTEVRLTITRGAVNDCCDNTCGGAVIIFTFVSP